MSSDDFFGGAIPPRPAPTGPPPQQGPLTDPRAPSATRRANSVASRSRTNLIVAVVGIAALLGGLWLYRAYSSQTHIEFPDKIEGGVPRVDEQSAVAKAAEEMFADDEKALGNDLKVALYNDGSRVFIIAAAEAGSADESEQNAFFEGFAERMKVDVTPKDVDPGSIGGRVQCASTSTFSYCGWISDDTLGFITFRAPGTDPALVTQSIRSEVEH